LAKYLGDTYAFIEAFTGHPRYGRILKAGGVVTTALNALELHYSLLRTGVAPDESERYSRATLRLAVEVPHEVAITAARTRFSMNEQFRKTGSNLRVSSVDAWGYAAAQALELPFLTGDPAFKGVPGVSFVT